MNVRSNILFLIFACLLTAIACTSESIPVKIDRFDRDFFSLDTNNIQLGLEQLVVKYPEMLPLFTVNLLHDQTNPNETPIEAAHKFLTAQPIRALFDTVQAVFPNLSQQEKELGEMFAQYHRLFPHKPVPRVVAIVSEYTTDAFTYGDSLCGIGLDMFLGPDFHGYNPELFPEFVRRQFRPEYIPVRLAKALAQQQMPEPQGIKLIDQMLYYGKILYLAKEMLPTTPDSMIMGYTRQQMEGSVANESEVWARILTQNLLYSEDVKKYQKLVNPSPNAPVVFQEAPGEIGNWIGWRIIDAYMDRNPNTTIQELLNLTDSQKLLEASRYKPRRS